MNLTILLRVSFSWFERLWDKSDHRAFEDDGEHFTVVSVVAIFQNSNSHMNERRGRASPILYDLKMQVRSLVDGLGALGRALLV